ncbi:Phage related hypothetical protein [Roseateles sp. YR242]|uniref:DUF1799 domain-containing protein n=1 Tax=Roseateles sp. YR242 TaxID=1855305 RepID=UPI0008C2A92D|nr:DUF1799 domain-containing protein [Roseateles sp. YR242]SEL11984.1 Phage related hypothetical protein [Roseateles sp. YR242]
MEDVAADYQVVLWPSTIESFYIFTSLDDQWLCGPAGLYALNAQSIESVFRMKGIPRRRWPELFEDIRELQAGAMQAMEENRPKKPQ